MKASVRTNKINEQVSKCTGKVVLTNSDFTGGSMMASS